MLSTFRDEGRIALEVALGLSQGHGVRVAAMVACLGGWLLIQMPSLAAESVGASAAPTERASTNPRRLRYVPRVYGERPSVAQLTALGRKIFSDPGLSASGKMACATCHSPEHAFGPPNALPVQLGGEDMRRAGTRSVPSLRYLQTTLPFTEHFFEDDETGGEDAGPTGGLTWDGRVNTPHEQARIPLLAAHEMGNASAQELAARLRRAVYANAFREAFSAPGKDVFDDAEQTLGWTTAALEVFQQSPAEFYPFSSKYDAFLRRQTQLSAEELRGLALFNDPKKGNCASCHPSTVKQSGAFPLFTDAGYVALGAPRNPEIPANRDREYYDLGLCGPLRLDLAANPDYCGRFKTPTLRNVAIRESFFHNGSLHSLKDVLEFYVQRDTRPERWYPIASDGSVHRYDDLPAAYHGNVNVEAPFAPRAGAGARLSAEEIQDVIAFLKTLTDGYRPQDATAQLGH